MLKRNDLNGKRCRVPNRESKILFDSYKHSRCKDSEAQALPDKCNFEFEGEIAVAAHDVLQRGVQPVANA
jgi:hypothetical protein